VTDRLAITITGTCFLPVADDEMERCFMEFSAGAGTPTFTSL
jgi:hypothetical protein